MKNETSPRIDMRAQALKIAKENLQTRGFNGFSFQDISQSLGIRKASLHYYFSSKEELGLALIEDYRIAFQQWGHSVEELSSVLQLNRFVNMFAAMSLHQSQICPIGVLCSDFQTLPKSMKSALSEFHQEQLSWMQKVLRHGVRTKAWRADLDVKKTAVLFLSSIQGSLQLARLQNNDRVVKQTGAQLLALMS